MTVSTGSGSPRTDEKPYLRFFPSMTQGSAANINRYFPKKISFAIGIFSLIAGFAFFKFQGLRDYFFQNQQKKSVEKAPITESVQPATMPLQPLYIPVQPATMPLQPLYKPVGIEPEIQPTVTHSKTARTWAEHREQLLSTKI